MFRIVALSAAISIPQEWVIGIHSSNHAVWIIPDGTLEV